MSIGSSSGGSSSSSSSISSIRNGWFATEHYIILEARLVQPDGFRSLWLYDFRSSRPRH